MTVGSAVVVFPSMPRQVQMWLLDDEGAIH